MNKSILTLLLVVCSESFWVEYWVELHGFLVFHFSVYFTFTLLLYFYFISLHSLPRSFFRRNSLVRMEKDGECEILSNSTTNSYKVACCMVDIQCITTMLTISTIRNHIALSLCECG